MNIKENVIVEYQIKDNIVRVIKDGYFSKKYGSSIRYLFQFQNSNNDISTTVKSSKTIIVDYNKTKEYYKTFTYKSLNMALKHFNKAVSALNNGINIK
jgi:predicted transcriptional regulator